MASYQNQSMQSKLEETVDPTSSIVLGDPADLLRLSSKNHIDIRQPAYFNDLQHSKNQHLDRASVTASQRSPTRKRPVIIRQSSRPLDTCQLRPVRETCAICLVQPPAGRLTKCNHQNFCRGCAQAKVKQSLQKDPLKVPVCDYPIIMTDRVTQQQTTEYCQAEILVQIGSIFYEFDLNIQRQVESAIHTNRLFSEVDKNRPCSAPDCNGYLRKRDHKCNRCLKQHCSSCWQLVHKGECASKVKMPSQLGLSECKQCGYKFIHAGGCPRVKCKNCFEEICYKDGELWSFRHHACGEDGVIGFISNFFSHYCCRDDTAVKDWNPQNMQGQ